MTGSVTDVVTNGSRAYALTSLPNEVRVLDVADALHPSTIVSAAAPASASSIAYDAGRVYVLADKLYSFVESTLAPAGERFTSTRADASQRTRTSGGCAIVTGRSDAPEQYSLPAWTAAASFDVPSNVRTFTVSGGRVVLLTNHSLEIWATTAAQQPSRRRSAR